MQPEGQVPILQRQPHPIVVAAIIAAVLLAIGYLAYLFEFLPVKPQSEFAVRLGRLAEQSGGQFEKLSAADQKYLNEHTSGRGAMALGAYLKSKK